MKSAAGLSISMLLFWTIADVFGYIGLLFSGETGTLLWLTLFFTVNNLVGCAVWLFYAKLYPRYFASTPASQDGYTKIDDDGNAENKGLLANDSDSDVEDGKHGQVLLLSPRKSNNKQGSAKHALLDDQDLLDTPVPVISIDNSINATGGGSGKFAPHLLDPTTISLIVCIIAVASIQVVDAKALRQVHTVVKDAAEEIVYTAYRAVVGQSDLPPCISKVPK